MWRGPLVLYLRSTYGCILHVRNQETLKETNHVEKCGFFMWCSSILKGYPIGLTYVYDNNLFTCLIQKRDLKTPEQPHQRVHCVKCVIVIVLRINHQDPRLLNVPWKHKLQIWMHNAQYYKTAAERYQSQTPMKMFYVYWLNNEWNVRSPCM